MLNRAHAVATSFIVALSFLVASAAAAIPSLQLYIEGSTYDSSTETWTTTEDDFKIWVIASGKKLPITDITLTAAVDSGETGSVGLTSSTTSVLSDPSTPIAPISNGLSADGAIPTYANGSSVPTHGEFGVGVSFYQWELGDATSADSPCGDFIDGFPSELNKDCQINVYDVSVTGYSKVHFDAFGVDARGGVIKAPFSHDAESGGIVPEPSAALVFCLGTLFVSTRTRRR